MINSATVFLEFQQSVFLNLVKSIQIGTESWFKILDQQQRMLLHAFDPKRRDDGAAHPRPAAVGPELTDKYGRRCHDIDVEKDL